MMAGPLSHRGWWALLSAACLVVAVQALATPQQARGAAALQAAEATPSVQPSLLDVQLWPSEPDGAWLIVTAEVPGTVTLPATLRLPVPDGAVIMWAGEILGQNVEGDVEIPYSDEQVAGARTIVLSPGRSREVQYEAELPRTSAQGDRTTVRLVWPQTIPADETRFAVRMAAATSDVQIDPAPFGAPQTNEAGDRLYSLDPGSLEVGDTYTITASFRQSAAGGSGVGGATSGASLFLIVAVVLLIVAVIALFAVIVRSRGGNKGDDDDEVVDEKE